MSPPHSNRHISKERLPTAANLVIAIPMTNTIIDIGSVHPKTRLAYKKQDHLLHQWEAVGLKDKNDRVKCLMHKTNSAQKIRIQSSSHWRSFQLILMTVWNSDNDRKKTTKSMPSTKRNVSKQVVNGNDWSPVSTNHCLSPIACLKSPREMIKSCCL